MKSIREINTTTNEGQILLAALGRLSSQPNYSDKTPDQILQELSKLADEIYFEDRVAEKPEDYFK